jgi:hypothetical protein
LRFGYPCLFGQSQGFYGRVRIGARGEVGRGESAMFVFGHCSSGGEVSLGRRITTTTTARSSESCRIVDYSHGFPSPTFTSQFRFASFLKIPKLNSKFVSLRSMACLLTTDSKEDKEEKK